MFWNWRKVLNNSDLYQLRNQTKPFWSNFAVFISVIFISNYLNYLCFLCLQLATTWLYCCTVQCWTALNTGIKKMAGKILHTLRLQWDIAFSNKELENIKCPERVGWGVMNKTNNPQIDTTPTPLQLHPWCYFIIYTFCL